MNPFLVAGVTDSESHARKGLGFSQALDDIPQAVVSAMAASFLEADRADRQVEVVMGHEELCWRELVKLRQGENGLPAAVHIGAGTQQVQILAGKFNALIQTREPLLLSQFLSMPRRKVGDPEGARIVTGQFILGAGIPQPDNGADGWHSVAVPLQRWRQASTAGAASGFAWGGCRSSSCRSFRLLLDLASSRLVYGNDREVVVGTLEQFGQFHALGEFQVAKMDHGLRFDGGHVHFDVFRQIVWQTDDLHFSHLVGDHSTTEAHATQRSSLVKCSGT